MSSGARGARRRVDRPRERQSGFYAGHGDGASPPPPGWPPLSAPQPGRAPARRSIRLSVHCRCLCLSLILLSTIAISAPIARQAVAAQVNVPPFPASPASGDIWNVTAPANLDHQVSLPGGSPGLTIDGNTETITLSGSNAFFNAPSANSTLTLSNVTITGGTHQQGGAIQDSTFNQSSTINIPINGSATFLGNGTGGTTGGAIYTRWGASRSEPRPQPVASLSSATRAESRRRDLWRQWPDNHTRSDHHP